VFPGFHDLNDSNRQVRTRMPGGVAGERSDTLAAPMPIYLPPVARLIVSRFNGLPDETWSERLYPMTALRPNDALAPYRNKATQETSHNKASG
jgi:hypothetical protein